MRSRSRSVKLLRLDHTPESQCDVVQKTGLFAQPSIFKLTRNVRGVNSNLPLPVVAVKGNGDTGDGRLYRARYGPNG